LIGNPTKNKNYQLYKYINKCLTEEKFLEDKKILNNKNKIISVKTQKGVEHYNVLPERNSYIF
jgi:hypothetical protein